MKKNIQFLFLIILFSLVAAFVFYGTNKDYYTTTQVDMFLAINHLLSSVSGQWWANITALGDTLILLSLLSFFVLKDIRVWAAFFGAIPLSGVLSSVGKAFFSIPRPAAIIDNDKFTVVGEALRGATSLPSGHTITIFTVVSAIIYIFFYSKKKIKHPLSKSIGLFLLAAVVAMSRVAVGAHWPLDLLLGAIIGCFGGIGGAILTFKFLAWWNWMTKPNSKYVHALLLSVISIAAVVEHPQLVIAWLSFIVASLVTIKLLLFKGNNEPNR
jgi:membrane-associated phospholipid phosphatase